MKTFALLAVLVLGLGGCSFDKADRVDAARAAITLAAEQLADPVVEILIEEGIEAATAKKVGEIVVRRSRAIANRVLEKLEE